MREALDAFGPILLFMLIPIWIPLFTVLVGALGDRLRRRPPPRGRVVPQARPRPEPAPTRTVSRAS